MYFRISLALLCLAVHGNHGQGMVVSGGYPDSGTSVEVYVPSTGQSCSLPPLPDARYYHTMDNLYICGGEYQGTDQGTSTSCLHFSSGQWTSYTLVAPRAGHTSWWTDQGLVLMGGYFNETAEIVPATEGQGSIPFTMKHFTWRACAIPDTTSGSVVITGGYAYDSEVSRYDLQGYVEDLPQLIDGRMGHGCGSFMRVDGTQVMMVAGGVGVNGDTLSSTEVLTTDSTAWTMVTPLPRAVFGVRGVSLGNTVYMTGGYDRPNEFAEVMEWNDEKQEWVEQGKLQMARSWHSVSTVQLEGELMDYCG